MAHSHNGTSDQNGACRSQNTVCKDAAQNWNDRNKHQKAARDGGGQGLTFDFKKRADRRDQPDFIGLAGDQQIFGQVQYEDRL